MWRLRLRTPPSLLALTLFVLLTVAHTWPLASAPGRWSRVDNGDMLLNAWAMAWVAHQLPRDPLHLFDANMFWPERLTLAYSEHLLFQGILGLPIRALGGSAVLAHNVAMLAGFALTGWAFCLLLHRWTGSWTAGVVAGSLAAFNAHTLTRLAHVQAVHLQFFALTLFAVDRVLAHRRLRDGVVLGVGVALQGLTSVYLLVFTAFAMLFAAVARLDAWFRAPRSRLAATIAVGVVVAGALSAPVLWPYYQLSRKAAFRRAEAESRALAATWNDYLATGARLHFGAWSRPFFERANSASFPGVVAVVLCGVALGRRAGWRDRRCRLGVALVVGGVSMSVVPQAEAYGWLHEHVPLLQAIRASSRFGVVALLGVAVLAGFGTATLRERRDGSGRRAWPALAALLVLLVNVEALRAPMGYTEFRGIPTVYQALARERAAVVLELPFPEPRYTFLNAEYLLNSTVHWRPLVNGYSSFRPARYYELYEIVKGFPGAEAIQALHASGVTHVVVRGGAYGTIDRALLVPVASDGWTSIYRLRQ